MLESRNRIYALSGSGWKGLKDLSWLASLGMWKMMAICSVRLCRLVPNFKFSRKRVVDYELTAFDPTLHLKIRRLAWRTLTRKRA
jgi:hypothetical protein